MAGDHHSIASRQPPCPLLLPALGVVAGALAAAHWSATWWLLCVALLIAGLALRRTAWPGGGTLVIAGIGVLVGGARLELERRSQHETIGAQLADEAVLTRVRGVVISPPQLVTPQRRNPSLPFTPQPYCRFVIAISQLETGPVPVAANGRIQVAAPPSARKLQIGETLRVAGWLRKPRPALNPGEPDWRGMYAALGIDGLLRVESVELIERLGDTPGQSAWTGRAIEMARGYLRGLLIDANAAPENDSDARDLLDAIVLGQRSALDAEVNEAFIRTGAVHALSISGFHLAILGGGVWWLLRRALRAGPRAAMIGAAVAATAYALLAEQNAPVLRALFTSLVLTVAVLLNRRAAPLNALCLAAIITLMISPLEVLRPGFQLSFVQVAALLIVAVPLYRWIMRSPDPLLEPRRDVHILAGLVGRWMGRAAASAVSVGLVGWASAMPLTLLHFGQIAPLGALQSLVLTPLAAGLVWTGFATLLAGLLAPGLAAYWSVPAALLATWTLSATRWLAAWPGTLIEAPLPPGWLVIATYAAALPALHLLLRSESPQLTVVQQAHTARRRRPALGALAVVGAAWAGWLIAPMHRPPLDLTIAAVGAGAATLLVTPDAALVIDCGSSANIDAGATLRRIALEQRLTSAQFLAISHANFDHFSGVDTLTAGLPIQTLAVSPLAVEDEDVLRYGRWAQAALEAERVQTLSARDRFALSRDVRIDVLWPPRTVGPETPANDTSLVFQVRCRGRRILLPGDAERIALRSLVEAHDLERVDLASDVLIAPHHGDFEPGCTGPFLERVRPRVVIVSGAAERPKFMQALSESVGDDVLVLQTWRDGAVRVSIAADGTLRVRSHLGRTAAWPAQSP